jgi:hypothetical protein
MKYTITKKSYLAPTSQAANTGLLVQASDQILDQINQRKVDRQQSAINSAALQDHIMKNFKLKDLDPFKKLPPRQPLRGGGANQSFQSNAREILANIHTQAQMQS